MNIARVGPSKHRDRDRDISPPHPKPATRRPKAPKHAFPSSSEDDAVSYPKLTFYPAFCFPLSPTYSAWVKLSCADVHALTTRRGFEGQRIYFLKNHPVRYIRLVGRIVASDEKPHARIWYLDDGSGRTLEVFCKKTPAPSIPLPLPLPLPLALPSANADTDSKPPNANSDALSSIYNADVAAFPLATWPGEEIKWRPPGTYFSTTTTPSNQGAASRYACQTATGTPLDTSALRLGALVKMKGTIGEFAGEKQVLLERFCMSTTVCLTGMSADSIGVLNSTTEEIQAWNELVSFRESVLANPWVVSSGDLQSLKRRAERRAGVARSTTNGVSKVKKSR